MILIMMTVEPGFEEQTFIPESLERISMLREKLDKINRECEIGVDGSISQINIQSALKAGANIFVSGKAVFAEDINENISKMKRLITPEY